MGRDGIAACLDCEVVFDLGYGSCSGWLDHTRTTAEYDALPDDYKGLGRNAAWRRFLAEHEAHRWEQWSSDWAHARVSGGRTLVCFDHDGEEVIADITGFRRVDCESAPGEAPPPA